MAFFFTCGTHTFTNPLKDYEQVTVQCQNCGNFSAKCCTRWTWFTLCFVPIIPFSFRPYHEVGCRICNFWQDMKYRPDVEQGRTAQIPMQNYAPGGSGGGGGGGAPQGQQQQTQGYGQGKQSQPYGGGGGPPGGPNTGAVYQ